MFSSMLFGIRQVDKLNEMDEIGQSIRMPDLAINLHDSYVSLCLVNHIFTDS